MVKENFKQIDLLRKRRKTSYFAEPYFIDNKKFIAASDNPKILKLTSLQLGKKLLKFLNNFDLSIVFIL